MKKNILVTGAAGNLGKAVVEKFLFEGHRVIAIVSPGSRKIIGTGDLVTLEADLSNEQSSADVVGKIINDYKTIDAALMLAGGYAPGAVADTDGLILNKMFSLNFETAYFIARPVFLQMINQASGRIVFIGARPALQPKDGKNSMAYALSKSLIFKLAEFLNAEGANKNVFCSVIVPSTIDTPANRAAMPSVDPSAWVKPEEIAEILAFTISDQSAPLRDNIFKVYGNA